MSFGAQSSDNEEMNEINMTPLIDVMLVLLIIFIITLPVVTHKVQVDLPQANNQETKSKPNVITLTIDKEGKTFWNDTLILENDLDGKLMAAAQEKPQPDIHIRGDKEVQYQFMIKTMASAQRAGLSKLGFVTEP